VCHGSFDRILPDEEINGMMSEHYHTEDLTPLGSEAEGGEITNGVLDVWVAVDGGYMTRFVMEGDETTEGETNHFSAAFDLLSVNEPMDIVAPEGCVSMEELFGSMGEMPGGDWSLLIFVGIPLPMTGAYTGVAISSTGLTSGTLTFNSVGIPLTGGSIIQNEWM